MSHDASILDEKFFATLQTKASRMAVKFDGGHREAVEDMKNRNNAREAMRKLPNALKAIVATNGGPTGRQPRHVVSKHHYCAVGQSKNTPFSTFIEKRQSVLFVDSCCVMELTSLELHFDIRIINFTQSIETLTMCKSRSFVFSPGSTIE